MNEIESYQQRMLRNVININRFDYQSNKSILAIANCPSKETIIIRTQMRWIGHLVRMNNVFDYQSVSCIQN